MRIIRDGEPRTATSTLTQLLSCEVFLLLFLVVTFLFKRDFLYVMTEVLA